MGPDMCTHCRSVQGSINLHIVFTWFSSLLVRQTVRLQEGWHDVPTCIYCLFLCLCLSVNLSVCSSVSLLLPTFMLFLCFNQKGGYLFAFRLPIWDPGDSAAQWQTWGVPSVSQGAWVVGRGPVTGRQPLLVSSLSEFPSDTCLAFQRVGRNVLSAK